MIDSEIAWQLQMGACAARSRREEEDDALPSSTTTNEEIARNPRLPNGLRARVRTNLLSGYGE